MPVVYESTGTSILVCLSNYTLKSLCYNILKDHEWFTQFYCYSFHYYLQEENITEKGKA